MKKRLLSLLLCIVMVLGLFSVTASAETGTGGTATTTTTTVDFTAQKEGAFLFAPKFGVEVSSDLAESYGYTDSVTDGVSALDVLVKAHEAALGASFTKSTAKSYLDIGDTGFITQIFGEKTGNCGFTVNGEIPHNDVLADDTYAPGGKSYTGYTVTQAKINDGDAVEFFLYQDGDALDNYPLYKQNGKTVSSVSGKPGQTLELVVDGYCIGYYGFVPMQALEGAGQVDALEDAKLAWVTEDNGSAKLTDVSATAIGEDGKISVKLPDEEGTCYICPPKKSRTTMQRLSSCTFSRSWSTRTLLIPLRPTVRAI